MVPGFNGAVEVSCGALHTCVRLSSGQVRCWGYNGYGQLGDNSVTTNYTPVEVDINTTNSVLTGAVQLTSGIYHTCARISDGTVRCWGYNGYGELGNGTTTAARIATPVQELRPGASSPITLTGVRHVYAGYYQTCAAMTDLTVRCWGRGDYGQIGDGALLTPSARDRGDSALGWRALQRGAWRARRRRPARQTTTATAWWAM
jgi:alpha-tubulin suppressor-like RCC1 family protein